jgi:hypothetical protein
MPKRKRSRYFLIILPIMFIRMKSSEYNKLKAMNRPNKYNAVKKDGYDSTKECNRAKELRLMEKA